MPIIKERFRRYKLEKEDDNFTIRLTDTDKVWFLPAKALINQPKRSTAMKQLAEIGSIVLHDQKMLKILDVIKGNSYRNYRLGIPEQDYKVQENDANVTPKEAYL
jgi:hypothetical protein